MIFNLLKYYKYKKMYKIIKKSGLFDEKYYLFAYTDVRLGDIDPIKHYIKYGAKEGRNPNKYFDTKFYLQNYNDVKNSGMNPLVHFILFGNKEGRSPHVICEQKERNKHPIVKSSPLYKELLGNNIHDSSKYTVLICAHTVGEKIFGSERSLLDMLEGASSKMNVILAAPSMNDKYFTDLKNFITKAYIFPYKWWKESTLIEEKVIGIFEKIIIDNNIIIVHTNTIMLREPLIAARNIGVTSLIHIRELITGDDALSKYIELDPLQIVQQINNSADYLIGNSKQTLKAYHNGTNNNYLLYNTLNLKEFHEKSSNDGKLHIGLISSNIPKKGIYDFVEVAKKCMHDNRLVFDIIGPINSLIEEIQHLKLQNIQILGYKESPQEALAELDIVVSLSNFTESFGRTVLEAMASKKPVVGYKWGAVQELIQDGVTGYLVEYRDVDSVARRLLNFANSPDLIYKMGQAGYNIVKEQFDINIYKTNMINIYDNIIKREKDKHINIAYFLWHFPVPSETFVLNELRILVRQNHNVKVYCKQSPHKDFKPDFPIIWERVESPEHFAKLLITNNIDIVHSHFVYPTVTEMVWPACKIAKKNFTFIAHAQDIFRYTNDNKNRIDEVSTSEYCSKVFVPAQYHFNYLLERGVPRNKMLINPNGVDPDLYNSSQEGIYVDRKKRSICAIHRFTEKKGLVNLINASSMLDDVTVNIYGYGDLEEEYKEVIIREKISNVHIKGGVKNREEMLEVFSKHDLFACPSVRAMDGDMDGIPTVLMEAMAAGIPVITTDISGIPDLITDGLTGIVTTNSPADIAKDIHRYYSLPNSKVEAMIDNARNKIKSQFNTRNLVENLLRVWEQKTIDLIVVSWNNLPELKEVCKRLLKYTTLPYKLVICDNNSKEDVKKYLRELENLHKEVTVIFNDTNSFVGPGTNLALENSNSDYAIYICGKEGFVFKYGWEKSFVKYMEHHPKVGQAGTLGYSPTYIYGKDYPQGVREFKHFRNKEFALKNQNRIFKHVQGGFFILRRKMYNEIGGFSNDVPHDYTDVEYSYYAESCGWELGQIPEMLALYNKTRPGLFSRIDENVYALHPPMLRDLPKIDKIMHNKIKLCNVCEWTGNSFNINAQGLNECPQCRSLEADRTLMRYLAESIYTYRRLPALAINLNDTMQAFWNKMFQGRSLKYNELLHEISTNKIITNADGKTYLIYINYPNDNKDEMWLLLLTNFYRLLHLEGELLIQLNENCKDPNKLDSIVKQSGFNIKNKIRFNSNVCQYDWHTLLVCTKGS